jgi:hypothetical protein
MDGILMSKVAKQAPDPEMLQQLDFLELMDTLEEENNWDALEAVEFEKDVEKSKDMGSGNES